MTLTLGGPWLCFVDLTDYWWKYGAKVTLLLHRIGGKQSYFTDFLKYHIKWCRTVQEDTEAWLATESCLHLLYSRCYEMQTFGLVSSCFVGWVSLYGFHWFCSILFNFKLTSYKSDRFCKSFNWLPPNLSDNLHEHFCVHEHFTTVKNNLSLSQINIFDPSYFSLAACCL